MAISTIIHGLTGTITHTLGKWKTRQLEASLRNLQEADNNDMQPSWDFQNKLRMNKTANHVAIKKQDGTECQGLGETLKRWEEWTNECFSKSQDSIQPRIEHITEEEWGKEIIKPPDNLHDVRKQAGLTQITKEAPEIETWTNQDYKEQDIDRELWNLANITAHGNDGIP